MSNPNETPGGNGPKRSDDQRHGKDQPAGQSADRDMKGRAPDADEKNENKIGKTRDAASSTLTEKPVAANNDGRNKSDDRSAADDRNKSDDRNKTGKPLMHETGAGASSSTQDRK